MKIAVTGSSGMLGTAIKQVFTDKELIALTRNDFDITDPDSTRTAIRDIKPDFLIHAAAFTDVDGCEADPEKAYLVNSVGARNVVIACEPINCPVLYISTDYVFDGREKTPYSEGEHPDPVNKYGLSKLIGEYFVSMLSSRFYIVRTSWLYGKGGKNFVDSILQGLSGNKEIDVVNDQTGSPTYTQDLASRLKELPGKGFGVYHITNSSYCTRYELALEIVRIKGIKARVNPVTSGKLARPAKRPGFSALASTRLQHVGISEPRHWKEALKEYLTGPNI
ncbi:dTDP-4-dehydrorhamnose reductase [bacterium BMS3Abin10]|nr:dTDP-4-dehydrorhamnose reductase [bacterium BMS3Abin10]